MQFVSNLEAFLNRDGFIFKKRVGYNFIKDTVSPAERCYFVGMKLEKVHELFLVCRICGKGVVFYNMAQYGLLYHNGLCN